MRFTAHACKSLSRCALVLSVHTFALLSCTPSGGESLLTATDAYGEGQYGKAISAARRAGEGASGVKLDQAHYIEGMAEFKLGHSDEAVKFLTLASHSTDHAIAADACVGLGTLEIRRERFAAAADAYRRAAAMLSGAERERALLIASRADARAKPLVVVNVPAPPQPRMTMRFMPTRAAYFRPSSKSYKSKCVWMSSRAAIPRFSFDAFIFSALSSRQPRLVMNALKCWISSSDGRRPFS